MSERVQNNRRTSRLYQLASQHVSSLLMNARQHIAAPLCPASGSPASFCNNFLNWRSQQCSISLMGSRYRPHSAQSVAKQSKSGGGDNPSPSFTPLLPVVHCHGQDTPMSSPSNKPGLWWLRTFKHSPLNFRDMRSHSSAFFRTHMSCDNTNNGYYPCPFSPALSPTMRFPDCVIAEVLHSNALSCVQWLNVVGDDLSALVTGGNSKHSNDCCPAIEGLPQIVCGSTGNGCARGRGTGVLQSDCSDVSLCHTEEGESWCGDYGDLCSEGEEEVEFSECDSQSDDEIVFSNEIVSSELGDSLEPLIPHQDKAPSQHLMSLLSEESGFGENSCTESYSDWEWDNDEQETECEAEAISCKDNEEMWKQFEGQALSIRSIHRKSSALPDSVCSQSLSPTTCSQQSPSTKRNRLKHSHFMQRLSVSHVCAQRHVNCCPSRTQEDHHSSESSPSTPSQNTSHHKKVSFVCDSELVHVHYIIVWNYAYRSCRRGPWEQYARDRDHFRCRIERVRSVIEPCLQRKLQSMSMHS